MPFSCCRFQPYDCVIIRLLLLTLTLTTFEGELNLLHARPGVHLMLPGLLQLTVFGISDRLLGRLQSVQNAAARLVKGACQCDHITPVLWRLHWLPVRQCVVFKIAGLAHQSLVGLAPAYLADDCRLLSDVGRRPLRSNSNGMRKLLVPRTHNERSDREFLGRRSSTVERLFTCGRDLPSTPSDNL